MPSLFEPCGIVQDEFFVAGTPVIAFSTGGLKETIYDWSSGKTNVNGFLFLQHSYRDFMNTIQRALGVFADKADYERLRESTSHTAIEVSAQARDFLSEFYRMRRCLLPNVEIPFCYTPRDGENPFEVLLVGDFTEWTKHPIKMEKEGDHFAVRLKLNAGDYRYKFALSVVVMLRYLVDGEWRTNLYEASYRSDGVNENHILTVPRNTNCSVSRVVVSL